jgi:glyoxylase-like metal-dependent hydrolase (beta-lactamase superfamily II)
MADALAPGIWWLHGTRGSNVYLVEADDGSLALVDTGFASSAEAILEEIRNHGGTLAAVLLTHMHRDHSGAAGEICRATGARLYLGRGDCLEREGRLYLRARVGRSHVGRFLAARIRNERPRAVSVHVALEGELEVLPGIRAVPVPGHTDGSYCFVLERASAAFVGDLVISHGGTLTRSMQMANRDDAQYLESLRIFADRSPEAGFPGHGQPVLAGFGQAMRELAALPRRPATPGSVLTRARRLWNFSRQMWRTRRRR